VYRILVGKPEGKRPLRRPRRRWEDNIKADLVAWCTHHATRHNTPIHIILPAPQLRNTHKALGTLPEDGNVMPKHVEATILN
jgi:hypothetical protein